MGFQLSPGVNVTEKDLTTIVPAIQTTAGGYVGAFQWGPVEQRVLVDSEANLVSLFGKPNTDTFKDFFTAANFLGYGNNLQVVRVANTVGNPTTTLTVNDIAFAGDPVGSTVQAITDAGTITAAGTIATTGATQMTVTTSSGAFAPGDKLYVTVGGTLTKVSTVDLEETDAIPFITGAEGTAALITGVSVDLGTGATLNVRGSTGSTVKRTIKIAEYNGAAGNGASKATIKLVDPEGNNFGGDATSTTTILTSGDRVYDTNETMLFSVNAVALTASTITGSVINSDTVAATSGTAGSLNATSSGTGLLIKNDDDYDSKTDLSANLFIAKYPGVLGNSLKVVVIDNSAWVDSSYSTYITEFDSRPAGTDVHILIIDEDGEWTDVAGDVVEKFADLSQTVGAKRDDGRSKYWKTVLNEQSAYLWAGGAALASTAGTSLSGAVDGNTVTTGQRYTGYQLFEDAETVDVSLLLGGPAEETLGGQIIDICDARKDCVAFLSPASSDVVGVLNPTTASSNVVDYRDNQLNKSSSYAVLDSGWKYQYDAYNDVFRYVPLNGDIAGLCVRTDTQEDPWFSPAGFNRGQIRGVTKLAFNPRKAHRDNLYKSGVNPVVAFPGEGTVLFGDKTLQSKPSAFDRINVRRLFIVLEKAIATAAKFSLFEFNDSFTRAQFKALVEPFLRDVQARRGITDFKVVCDESNNTGEVIDGNRFVADIFVKPARSINFIQLNFIATRTGVSFDEITG